MRLGQGTQGTVGPLSIVSIYVYLYMDTCLTIDKDSITYHFDKCIQCIQDGHENELSDYVMKSIDTMHDYANINVNWYMDELKLTDVQYIVFICKLCVNMQQKFPREDKRTTIHVYNLSFVTKCIFEAIQRVIVLPNVKFVIY
jgi:hypothetical protein